MADIKQVLELVTPEIVEQMMQEFGSPCSGRGETSSGSKYLTFKTICHGGDSANKLWYYQDTKSFQCWTCCGNMSIFDLIGRVKNYSFKESLDYLSKKVGYVQSSFNYGFNYTDAHIAARLEELKKFSDIDDFLINPEYTRSKTEITHFYDTTIFNIFENDVFYEGWVKEGISIPSMKKYNINWYEYMNYIIIPHYDINGRLIGIRRRSLNPEDANNKYMPLIISDKNGDQEYGHPLGMNLYGIHINKKRIQQTGTVILVESEKSVLLSDTFYGDNSITLATCGFNVTRPQIKLLRKMGVDKVYLAFDNDYNIAKEGIYKRNSASEYRNYLNYCTRLESISKQLARDFKVFIISDNLKLKQKSNIFLLDTKDSPFDKGKEVFERLLASADIVKND